MTKLTTSLIEKIINKSLNPNWYPREMVTKDGSMKILFKLTRKKVRFTNGEGYTYNFSLIDENGVSVADMGTMYIIPCRWKAHKGMDVAWMRNRNDNVDISLRDAKDGKSHSQWHDFAITDAFRMCEAVAEAQGSYTEENTLQDREIMKFDLYLCSDD